MIFLLNLLTSFMDQKLSTWTLIQPSALDLATPTGSHGANLTSGGETLAQNTDTKTCSLSSQVQTGSINGMFQWFLEFLFFSRSETNMCKFIYDKATDSDQNHWDSDSYNNTATKIYIKGPWVMWCSFTVSSCSCSVKNGQQHSCCSSGHGLNTHQSPGPGGIQGPG